MWSLVCESSNDRSSSGCTQLGPSKIRTLKPGQGGHLVKGIVRYRQEACTRQSQDLPPLGARVFRGCGEAYSVCALSVSLRHLVLGAAEGVDGILE